MKRASNTKGRALAPALAQALALSALGLGAPPALAAGAHVHGQGALDVAVEGTLVDLFLRAPLGDVAGEEGRDAEALQARFGEAGLFTFTGARCALARHEVEIAAVGESDAAEEFSDEFSYEFTGDVHEEDEHGGQQDHDGEHAHEDQAAHGDHQAHGGDGEDHSGHSDALLSWRYECDDRPEGLSSVALFERVALERILVQSIGPGGVVSVTLTPAEPGFTLR